MLQIAVLLELIFFKLQPQRKKDMCYSAFLSNFLEAKSELLTSTGLYVNSANLFSGHIMPYCGHQLGNNEDGAK